MAKAEPALEVNKEGLLVDPRSKKRFIINIPVGGEQDDPYVFVGGMSSGDIRIKRGVDVEVSHEVVERLDNAIVGRAQKEVNERTGEETIVFNDAKRFPYTIVGVAA